MPAAGDAARQRDLSANRWIALFLGLVMFACYGIITIGAGHGVAPLALALVWGLTTTWLAPVVLAYIGAALCVACMFISHLYSHMILRTAGGLLLCASAVWFLIRSESLLLSAMTAIPFFCSLVVWFTTMASRRSEWQPD